MHLYLINPGIKAVGRASQAQFSGSISNCTAKIDKQMHIKVGDEIGKCHTTKPCYF